jgi:hypothetical protein
LPQRLQVAEKEVAHVRWKSQQLVGPIALT